MMEFQKRTMFKEEWVIIINGKDYPISGLLALTTPAILMLMVVFTVNYSFLAGIEQVKAVSFLSNIGIFDVNTHQYLTCVPSWDSSAIKPAVGWICQNATEPNTQRYNYSWLNQTV